MPTQAAPEAIVEEVSPEEGRAMLDRLTNDRLGIRREAFLARLDAGEYLDTDDEEILRLVMLAPFGR